MTERWLPIDGHAGYEVSDLGRVRSPRGLLKSLMGARYPRVVLTRRKYESIHRLVLAAFVGPDPRQVNHKDGDRSNNGLHNLEYCTGSENMKHAFRTGLQSNKGGRHSQALLDDEKVRFIRQLLAQGRTQKEVGTMLNIHQSAISRVKLGLRWGHVANVGDEQAKNQLVAV